MTEEGGEITPAFADKFVCKLQILTKSCKITLKNSKNIVY